MQRTYRERKHICGEYMEVETPNGSTDESVVTMIRANENG